MIDRRKRRTIRVTKARRIILFFSIYIILFTANFSMMAFSRYNINQSGNASIGIAKWDVSVNNVSPNNFLNIVSGDTPQSYKIKVKSQSEVSTTYTIILSDVPSELEVSLDGREYKKPNANNKITYSDIGSFDINDDTTECEHTLSFKAPIDSDIPNINEISIDIKFSQVI